MYLLQDIFFNVINIYLNFFYHTLFIKYILFHFDVNHIILTGASWTGPGLKPAPKPTPHPGNCGDMTTQIMCESTTTGGKDCEWCYLKALGLGICQDPGSSC